MSTLLVVDDNQQNLYMLQVLLSANGFQVELASNGAEALEKARRTPPDMIISDILMPVMDGFSLCRACKEDERLKNIPFVFYTATYTDPKDEEFALSLGADRFIIKPVEPDRFLALLSETWENYEAGKRVAAPQPVEEAEHYKEYNAVLIRKLEDKMLQLEEANRILERDITERKRAEEKIHHQNAIFQGINRIFAAVLTTPTEDDLGRTCLAVAEEITGSKFGFLGEIGADGLLHDIAISDPGWEACQMADPAGHRQPPRNFKLHGIYGRVLLDGKSVFTNDPDSHPDRIGTPLGHPPLKAFLGVPLVRDGRTIGMVALGNREGGYRQEQLEAAEALGPVIVEAFLRKRAEETLQVLSQQRQLALDAARMGWWHYDPVTRIASWDDLFKEIFGVTGYESPSDEILKQLHPQDLPGVWAKVEATLDPASPQPYSAEYRINRLDGSMRWIEAHGIALFEGIGKNRRAVSFVGTVADITDRKHAEKALQESSQELKLFAYSVAHDLKSPAIGVYALTKRLSKYAKEVLDEKGRNYCDQILKASEHIAALVDKVNTYIATKEARLSIERISIAEILRMLKDEFAVQLTIRRIQWLQPETTVEIKADRLSMLRAFRNFVDNSLKYGGQRLSRIWIGYEESEDFHILSFSDNGKGLKEEASEKIFRAFQREETSRGVEGAGLGLTIVKEIAEQHGGTVWVEPRSKKGTTFYLSISKNL